MTDKSNTTAKPAVDKRAKFEELAASRMDNALAKIANIGKLANKSSYDFTEEHATKIDKALKAAVAEVEARFSNALAGKKSNTTTFTF